MKEDISRTSVNSSARERVTSPVFISSFFNVRQFSSSKFFNRFNSCSHSLNEGKQKKNHFYSLDFYQTNFKLTKKIWIGHLTIR